MMNMLKKIIVLFTAMALLLGGACVPAWASAETVFPSETDPFKSTYYIGATDVDTPFFDVILPQIRANIAENNKHTISPYYDAFPLADNPENFQGLGHTTYANINGKTVTAEAFFRYYNESLNDPNNGLGLLIYQCIEYKRAHPEEDVKITFSSYRTSASAAVCVIPESKYYGYMRSLYTTNYDEHGFVRISFMFAEAARMGIEVTLVNHLNSYSKQQYNPSTKKLKSRGSINMVTYFDRAKETKCYDKYAKGKTVSDFMNCANVAWEVGDKTCDMQHVKSATVSHYLATDGTEHQHGLFFSSANLDDNDYKACNGNNGAQTGTIISDHSELYRVTYNFMQLMTRYQKKEDIYYLRKLVNEINNKQIALIKSGREEEIPKDEQIVYLGSENDPVFELYFTPFGGSADTWDVEKNPFCKYISKLPQSTDYVELYWNEFGYGDCYIGEIFQKMLKKAYCDKPNIRNKISMRVSGFDTTDIENLVLGKEIGARSIKDGTNIHSKDILLSYEEEGVRHNVSLVTSCNFYMIAFNYRTNSLLVINETEESGGNYYEIAAKKYSYEMVDYDLMIDPPNLTLKAGESYTPDVIYSGNKPLTWSVDNERVATVENGTIKTLKNGTTTVRVTDGEKSASLRLVSTVDYCTGHESDGFLTFNENEQYILSEKLSATPLTFKATINVKKEDLKAVNTIISSDDGYGEAMSFYLDQDGKLCFMVRDKKGKNTKAVYTIGPRVATGEDVEVVVSYVPKSNYINAYVNGEWKSRVNKVAKINAFTEKNNYVIGGDHLCGNATYFPGKIYELSIWNCSKGTAELTEEYQNGFDYNQENLLAAYDFKQCKDCLKNDLSHNGNTLEHVVLWQDKEDVAPVGDYDYSFAVIGDTQTMCENDPEAMESIYDWLVANKEDHKIEYVMGLGDITDDSTEREWEDAVAYISKLNGVIPYSVARGNHDKLADFNSAFSNGYYETTVDGCMTEGDLTNTYRYLTVGGVDYLILTLDFASNSSVLAWVDSVAEAHPDHRIIITTHAYMYRDGTTIDAGDLYPPSYYTDYEDAQNGDQMWEKCFSKHANIIMVLSGHDPWQHIVYRQDRGEQGNTVTQMLIDAQYVDKNIGSTAMVAMFYFSNDSNTLTVRYYSVAKDCYGSVASQFTLDLNILSGEEDDGGDEIITPDDNNPQETPGDDDDKVLDDQDAPEITPETTPETTTANTYTAPVFVPNSSETVNASSLGTPETEKNFVTVKPNVIPKTESLTLKATLDENLIVACKPATLVETTQVMGKPLLQTTVATQETNARPIVADVFVLTVSLCEILCVALILADDLKRKTFDVTALQSKKPF